MLKEVENRMSDRPKMEEKLFEVVRWPPKGPLFLRIGGIEDGLTELGPAFWKGILALFEQAKIGKGLNEKEIVRLEEVIQSIKEEIGTG